MSSTKKTKKQGGSGLFDIATDAVGLTSQKERDDFNRKVANGVLSGATAFKNSFGSGKKQRGGNFFGDALDWTTTAAKDTGKFLGDTKIISRGADVVGGIASVIPLPQAQGVATGAKIVSQGAKAVGWGKTKKAKPKAKKANASAKTKKKVLVYA